MSHNWLQRKLLESIWQSRPLQLVRAQFPQLSLRDGEGAVGLEEGQQQAGEGREERRSRGRTTGVQDLKHNFEKLNGFKSKGMWAGTGAAGRAEQEGAAGRAEQQQGWE